MVPERDNPVAAGNTGNADGAAGVAVEIGREEEDGRGWRFEVSVSRPGGAASRHDFTLSWADYEYWSHGRVSPSRVAQSVIESLIALRPDLALPARFDASTCRRWAREMDERLAEGL